jgi:hypothetical protein
MKKIEAIIQPFKLEDVKSAATRALPTYRLKRRLLWALYGLTVQEV